MAWVSDPALVSAISNEGGFGVLAAGNMPPHVFEKTIAETRALTDKPFGVNFISVAPAFSENVDVAIANRCPFVFFAGGIPPAKEIEKVKAAGLKVVCFAPILALAKRMVRNGVDALVIEGHEAGGHVGPVATSILVQEFLPEITEVPVFVAGGIGTGEMIAHLLSLGAAGVQLGTRFVAAEECTAHAKFKEAFIRASARDAMPTTQFDHCLPTIPVRALVNEGTKDFNRLQFDLVHKVKIGDMAKEEAQIRLEEFWLGALRRAVVDGDIEHGSVMAGQSVAFVKKVQPVREILSELVDGAERELSRMASA
jgi:enoyl-[acyl-carrier protein] reductase II